ncbi:hypothetical protein ACEPAG_3930 [Sanghuangporus baumii]
MSESASQKFEEAFVQQRAVVQSMSIAKHENTGEIEMLLPGRKLATVFAAFCLAFFLVALDQTILSTALPTIASKFDAVKDLSWIASAVAHWPLLSHAYFLPQAAFMLFFGKVLAFEPPKTVFLVSIGIFEVGSLLCAVAPSVNILIFGRAVAGLGATGLWVSIMSMIARITTLKQRPILMGLFGAVFAISSIVGPLMGGAFSDHVTWRWCFYINLPVGCVAFIVILIWLPYLSPIEQNQSVMQSWLTIDWLGTFLNFCMVTFLLIALQWGGNEKPWNDPVVIAFLALFAFFLFCFIVWEWNVLGASLASFFIFVCFVIFNYHLPLLYQVRGHSATRSGIDILGFMISGIISISRNHVYHSFFLTYRISATLTSGAIASITGYAWPILVISPLLASAGFGLFFTVSEATRSSRILGFQILVGVGLGCVTQLPVVVSQADFANQEHLVPQATSLVTFLQLIGSSVGLATAGAVFSGQLRAELHVLAPDLPQELHDALLESVKAIFTLPDNQRAAAIEAYVTAIEHVLLIGVPAAALASAFALIVRFEKMKKMGEGSSAI